MTEKMSSVSHGEGSFMFERNSARHQFDLRGGCVDAFAHSGTQLTMNDQQRTNCAMHEIFEFWRECRNDPNKRHKFVSFVPFVSSWLHFVFVAAFQCVEKVRPVYADTVNE